MGSSSFSTMKQLTTPKWLSNPTFGVLLVAAAVVKNSVGRLSLPLPQTDHWYANVQSLARTALSLAHDCLHDYFRNSYH